MSIIAAHPEIRIALSNISWATYEALVAENDSPGKRLVYDRGTLEIIRVVLAANFDDQGRHCYEKPLRRIVQWQRRGNGETTIGTNDSIRAAA